MRNMWKLPGNAHHTRLYSRIIVIQKITFQTAACLNPWRKTNILFLLGPLKQWHHPKHHKTSLRHPQFGHWVSQPLGFPNSLFLASNMGLAVRLGHALPCACATYCTCCLIEHFQHGKYSNGAHLWEPFLWKKRLDAYWCLSLPFPNKQELHEAAPQPTETHHQNH